jgi:hypothetical protein
MKAGAEHSTRMKTILTPVLTALALALPLTGANAQQWTTNNLPSGLIAWWAAEGDMLDTAGAHHGSGDAPPTYAPGRFGQAFQFNGADQSVSIPDIYADLDSWTQFTLEAWVSFDITADAPGPGRCVISKVGTPQHHYEDNFGYQFGFAANATQFFCLFNTNGQLWPGFATVAYFDAPLPINTWYHIAATYDHNAVKLFFNGLPLVTNVIGPVTIANTPSSLRLSKDDNDNVAFGGRIDDARIYNRALSAAEIAYLYAGPALPVTQGLKLHFDANNANGDGARPAEGSAVTTWRDLGGLGLDATPLFVAAPVYRTNALNGRAGVDFSQSGADALATAFSSQFDFTNCTILMVANGAGTPIHVSISAPTVVQEFLLGDKAIYHHSSGYHWVNRTHQDSPAGYYIQAGLFGTKSNELANCINGVFSTNRLVYSWEIGQQSPVADYLPVARQAVLGWRNSDALGDPPIAIENFGGVICEVLAYDRQLSAAEVDAMTFFLAGKYDLAVASIPPPLWIEWASASSVALSWESTAGRRYQLQSASSLPAAIWLNHAVPFLGTGGVLTTNIPLSSEPKKFFRLQIDN